MTRSAVLATLLFGAMPAQPTSAQPSQEAAGHLSGSYKVSGSAVIRPSLIWDDGQKTFLNWPENVEAPAIFAIDAGGNESLVNSYYRDGRFVIDAVYSRLLFRLDRLTARADRKAGRS
jgi:type IV secretion system protein VirB9